MQLRTTFPVSVLAGHDGFPGGIVYYKASGLQCARRWVKPDNPQTAQQIQIRTYFTQAAQAFKNLTDAQRQAWATFCANHKKSYLGTEFILQEMPAFVWINTLRLIDGQTITTTAPSAEAGFSASAIANVAYNSGTSTLSFDVTHNGSAGTGKWLIRITDTLASAQRNPRPSDWRLAAGVGTNSIVDVQASPQTISIANPVFTWSDGDYMAIMVVPLSDDYVPGARYIHKGTITVS